MDPKKASKHARRPRGRSAERAAPGPHRTPAPTAGSGPASPLPWLAESPSDVRHRIVQAVSEIGEPPYRVRQVHQRLWQRPVGHWEDALELPRSVRRHLAAVAPLPRLELACRQESRDGTVKFLWRLEDGLAVESVWIPEGSRSTLCISSQAGCAYACRFCATGRMGFQRHLRADEITGQVREVVLADLGRPSNVVFMGMGEPLHNWQAVDRALTILNDTAGFGIGARHITVSTVGIIPRLADFARRPEQFRLAISLHAATSDRRAALMPIEKKFPLDQLVAALERFRRRVTLEYVLIRGANDARDDAVSLSHIARRLAAHVNLLPLHPGGDTGFQPTAPSEIRRFARWLEERGTRVSIRRSRGLDIAAACGQLRVVNQA